MTRPRVLLADDHAVVVHGLKSLIADEFEVVDIVADGHAMVERTAALRPDVVVADVSMPGLGGIDALEAMRKRGLSTPVVFLTMHREVGYARRALRAGAAGYLLKLDAPEELVRAIRVALDGGTYLSPELARAVLEPAESTDAADTAGRVAALSAHQIEILRMLADGLSAKEIARKLDLSPRTVESHKYNMMESLGAQSSAELIRLAIRHGIVEP